MLERIKGPVLRGVSSFFDVRFGELNRQITDIVTRYGPGVAKEAGKFSIKYPALAGAVLLATPQGRTVAASTVSGAIALAKAPAVTLFGGENERDKEAKTNPQTDPGGLWGAPAPAVSKAGASKATVKRKPIKRKAVKRKAVKRKAVKRKAVKRKVKAR